MWRTPRAGYSVRGGGNEGTERMLRTRLRLLRTKGLLVLLALVLVGDLAQAQGRRRDPDKWEFSFFWGVGWWLAGRQEFPTLTADNGSNLVRIDAGSGWVMGVRISENLSNFFAAEFEYAINDQPVTALEPCSRTSRLEPGSEDPQFHL